MYSLQKSSCEQTYVKQTEESRYGMNLDGRSQARISDKTIYFK